MESKTIITIGIQPQQGVHDFLSELNSQGFSIIGVNSPEEFINVFPNHEAVTVVIYNRPGSDSAMRTLRMITRSTRRVPVIVLVDETKLDEYFELMCQGAFDYFDFSDHPTLVEQTIHRAALMRAC